MFAPAMEERGQHPHDFPSAHLMLAASMGALFRPSTRAQQPKTPPAPSLKPC